MRRWQKVLGGLALGLVLAGVAAKVIEDVVVVDACDSIDPNSWLYWLMGCRKDSAGGGAGGAG